MSAKTDEDVFLDYCRKRDIRPEVQYSTADIAHRTYKLPRKVIQITYFGMRITMPEKVTVYFHGGKWIGGTNWLWDNRLPWVRRRRARFRARANKDGGAK